MNKSINISIHSLVDVITNSSTEIYISTHQKSIECLKELIDFILKASCSNKKVDELFEFEIINHSLECDELSDCHYDQIEYFIAENLHIDLKNVTDEMVDDWKTHLTEEQIKSIEKNCNCNCNMTDILKIIPKSGNQKELDIISHMKRMLRIEDGEY